MPLISPIYQDVLQEMSDGRKTEFSESYALGGQGQR